MLLSHPVVMPLGQRNVTQLRTLSLKRTQVELVLTMKKIKDLSLVLALTVKDSLRLRTM